MLHAPQNRLSSELGEFARRFARQPDKAVQFIHRAVGLDAQVVFRQTLAAGKAGFAGIAAPRVNTVDRKPGLLEGVHHIFIDYLARARLHFTPATTFSSGDGSRKSPRSAVSSALRRFAYSGDISPHPVVHVDPDVLISGIP